MKSKPAASSLYLDFPLTDGSRICVQRQDKVASMPYIRPDRSIPVHAHEFYEMVLIHQGRCSHFYENEETTLVSGDLFMIPPHRTHAYRYAEDVLQFNCQFYPDALSSDWLGDIRHLSYDRLQKPAQHDDVRGTADINRQGILHLNRDQCAGMNWLFNLILNEQKAPNSDSERIKRCTLQLILALLKRVREQQFAGTKHAEQWKQQMIGDTLKWFEKDITSEWDCAKIAEHYHISESYFRSIFKDVTGLPPRQYLNRMRILRAISLIQHHGASLSEASRAIGIHDFNYFSRLCRTVTGYSPSHFRRQED